MGKSGGDAHQLAPSAMSLQEAQAHVKEAVKVKEDAIAEQAAVVTLGEQSKAAIQ